MSRRESDRNRKLQGMLAAQRAKTDACKRVTQEYRNMLTQARLGAVELQRRLADAQTVAQLRGDLLRERDAQLETKSNECERIRDALDKSLETSLSEAEQAELQSERDRSERLAWLLRLVVQAWDGKCLSADMAMFIGEIRKEIRG